MTACTTCRHYLPTVTTEEQTQPDGSVQTVEVSRRGTCRRYPPDPLLVNGNHVQYRFRLIEAPANSGCGEYSAKEV